MRENKAADLPVFFGNCFGEGGSTVARSEGVGKAGRVRSETVDGRKAWSGKREKMSGGRWPEKILDANRES